MAGFVPFRNICAIFNCIAFKLILCFNSATSYTRKTLGAMPADTLKHSELADKIFKTLFLFLIIFCINFKSCIV